MEPLAGFSPPAAAAEGADKGGGGGGGGGGTVVEWQERITLHYRLFPVDIVAPAAAENSGSEGSGEHRFLLCFRNEIASAVLPVRSA